MYLEGRKGSHPSTHCSHHSAHHAHTLLEMKSRMLDVEPTTPMPRRLACDHVAVRSRV